MRYAQSQKCVCQSVCKRLLDQGKLKALGLFSPFNACFDYLWVLPVNKDFFCLQGVFFGPGGVNIFIEPEADQVWH